MHEPCQIDTCGENRESGEPWPATRTVHRDDGTAVAVCDCHADGWEVSEPGDALEAAAAANPDLARDLARGK